MTKLEFFALFMVEYVIKFGLWKMAYGLIMYFAQRKAARTGGAAYQPPSREGLWNLHRMNQQINCAISRAAMEGKKVNSSHFYLTSSVRPPHPRPNSRPRRQHRIRFLRIGCTNCARKWRTEATTKTRDYLQQPPPSPNAVMMPCPP